MQEPSAIRLGVNIDHVATIRNARGGHHPDPLQAALLAVQAGADGITAHLREDRRHITDNDIVHLRQEIQEAQKIPLNLEMAATAEMLAIAQKAKPHACCLVPERREEKTTEGGLSVVKQQTYLQGFIRQLQDIGIRVSLFIDPEPQQLQSAVEIGADIVELHTGDYANACLSGDSQLMAYQFSRLQKAAILAKQFDIELHAGHGLTYDNVTKICSLPSLRELNIGHFIVGEAIFSGFIEAVQKMRSMIRQAI